MDEQPFKAVPNLWDRIADRLRAWPWLAIAMVALFSGVYIPSRIFAVVWMFGVIASAAYMGYWIDRSLFHNARPADVDGDCRCAAWQRRAIVIAATEIAMALAAGGSI